MNEYRLYPIGETGHVLGPARKFAAKDDREAMDAACHFEDFEAVELWRGSYYVATLTRNPASPQSDCIIVAKD